jgi:hypothetical protein
MLRQPSEVNGHYSISNYHHLRDDAKTHLTARLTRTQTRKGGRPQKVLLRFAILRKRSLGPVNGGVRPH